MKPSGTLVILIDSFHSGLYALANLRQADKEYAFVLFLVRARLKKWFSPDAIAYLRVGNSQGAKVIVMPDPPSPITRGESVLDQYSRRASIGIQLREAEAILTALLGDAPRPVSIVGGNSRFLAVADSLCDARAIARIPHGLSDELAPRGRLYKIVARIKSRIRGRILGRRFWGLDLPVQHTLFGSGPLEYSPDFSLVLEKLSSFHHSDFREKFRSELVWLLLVPEGASSANEVCRFIAGVLRFLMSEPETISRAENRIKIRIKMRPTPKFDFELLRQEVLHLGQEFSRIDLCVTDEDTPAEILIAGEEVTRVVGTVSTSILNAYRTGRIPVTLLHVTNLDTIFGQMDAFTVSEIEKRQAELEQWISSSSPEHYQERITVHRIVISDN